MPDPLAMTTPERYHSHEIARLRVSVCTDCGVVVGDTEAHDRWHNHNDDALDWARGQEQRRWDE